MDGSMDGIRNVVVWEGLSGTAQDEGSRASRVDVEMGVEVGVEEGREREGHAKVWRKWSLPVACLVAALLQLQ